MPVMTALMRPAGATRPCLDQGIAALRKAASQFAAVPSSSLMRCANGSGGSATLPSIYSPAALGDGYIESFNARQRDELLNGEIFYSLGYRPAAPEAIKMPTWTHGSATPRLAIETIFNQICNRTSHRRQSSPCTCAPLTLGTIYSALARRHDIRTSQHCTWRRELRGACQAQKWCKVGGPARLLMSAVFAPA